MKTLAITFNDFELDMHIGIFPKDKTEITPITINIMVHMAYPIDDFDDNIHNVVNYADIREGILALSKAKHYNLLESFSEAILNFLFSMESTEFVSLQILKPEIFDDVGNVGVSFEVTRADFEDEGETDVD